MEVAENIKVMELLASRICHDLISPVNAINNGIELMAEMGGQVGDESFALIAHSAEQSIRRLRLFRLCYGLAGADAGTTPENSVAQMQEYLEGTKVKLAWSEGSAKMLADVPRGFGKVFLNLLVIAAEHLVYGGTLEVTMEPSPLNVKITANGRGAGVKIEAWEPLAGTVNIDNLSAKTVHPYITGRFALQYGHQISWSQPNPDELQITLAAATPLPDIAETPAS